MNLFYVDDFAQLLLSFQEQIIQNSRPTTKYASSLLLSLTLCLYFKGDLLKQQRKTHPNRCHQRARAATYVRLFLQSSCVQFVAHHRDCVVGGQGAPPGLWRRTMRRVRSAEPTQPLSARHGLHSPHSETRQSINPGGNRDVRNARIGFL